MRLELVKAVDLYLVGVEVEALPVAVKVVGLHLLEMEARPLTLHVDESYGVVALQHDQYQLQHARLLHWGRWNSHPRIEMNATHYLSEK